MLTVLADWALVLELFSGAGQLVPRSDSLNSLATTKQTNKTHIVTHRHTHTHTHTHTQPAQQQKTR